MENLAQVQAPEIERIELDPYGDVVFVLKQVELRMSSKVLSLASPVFKALLKPNFSEGQALRDGKTARIEFPDDDVEAMTTLCQIIHFQPGNTVNVKDELLINLAMLTDKYDCVGVTRCFGESALSSRLSSQEEHISDGRLLFPAYILDDAVSFQIITKRIVYELKGVGCASYSVYGLSEVEEGMLPAGLVRMLVNHEWKIKKEFLVGIENLVSSLMRQLIRAFDEQKPSHKKESKSVRDNPNFRDPNASTECPAQKTQDILDELTSLNLWPVSAAYDGFTLSYIIGALVDSLLERHSVGIKNMEAETGKMVRKAMLAFDGLCLDCTKNGWEGFKKNRKMCRIPHEGFRGIPEDKKDVKALASAYKLVLDH